eukprot:527886-Rhodomonas_salina.1
MQFPRPGATPMTLRARYAMSSTEGAYGAIGLRARYAMCGTDMRMVVLPGDMEPSTVLSPTLYPMPYVLYVCHTPYALCPTPYKTPVGCTPQYTLLSMPWSTP